MPLRRGGSWSGLRVINWGTGSVALVTLPLLLAACSGDEASEPTDIGVTAPTSWLFPTPFVSTATTPTTAPYWEPTTTTSTEVPRVTVVRLPTVIAERPTSFWGTIYTGLGSGQSPAYDDIVRAYIDSFASLEELAAAIEVPEPIEIPMEEWLEWGGPLLSFEEFLSLDRELEELKTASYDNGQEWHTVSLRNIARHYSNEHLSDWVCDWSNCFEDAMLPIWWVYGEEEWRDSYHRYISGLALDLGVHLSRSRLEPLIFLHSIGGFRRLHCWRTLGMDIEGLAGHELLSSRYNLSSRARDETSYYRGEVDPAMNGEWRITDNEIARRGAEIGLTEAELQDAVDGCEGEETKWIFPLPFDLGQAHQFQQQYLLLYLEDWVEENDYTRPWRLTITE